MPLLAHSLDRSLAHSLARSLVLCLLSILGGCVTVADSPLQQLEVRTVLDYREIGGVGCILSNDAGRWYVVAPARVTVTRSAKPLAVSCKKAGTAVAAETVQSRFDADHLIGNLVINAGYGAFADRHFSEGYGYPATLTVLMAPPLGAPGAAAENPVASKMF